MNAPRVIPPELLPLFGNAVDAMETAKAIVGNRIRVDPAILADIGADKSLERWSRIAAIYVLGLLGKVRYSPMLRGILGDEAEDATIRGHAAEALGNLRDKRSAVVLQRMLSVEAAPELRESLSYALQELGR